MSQENCDLIRKGIDAFRRADWDTMAATLDPYVLVRTDASWPEQHIYGREAVIDFYRGLWESAGADLRIEETLDLGDRVLIRTCWNLRGHQSAAEGEQRSSSINTVREGRTILVEFFLEHEQALKAVGLA